MTDSTFSLTNARGAPQADSEFEDQHRQGNLWLTLGGSALAGTVAALGWAPVALPALCLLGYAAVFLLLVSERHSGRALAAGAFFAFGLHGWGQGWVFDALLRAQAGGALAVVGSALFFMYLAVFTAVPAALTALWLSRLRDVGASTSALPGVLVFAALLALGELARSLIFNGVTGLSLGYALVPTWAAGWLPVVGVYGVSFIAYALAAALGQVVRFAVLGSRRGEVMGAVTSALPISVGLACLLFGGGSVLMQHAAWVQPVGSVMSFRLIQGYVGSPQRHDPRQREAETLHYGQTLSAEPADLIVTPETALPVHAAELGPSFWSRLASFSLRTGSHVFVGVGANASDGRSFNSVFHVSASTPPINARYDKVDLMPVGEYTPPGLQWFTRRLTLSQADLSAGGAAQPLFLLPSAAGRPQLRVGALVCHEDGRGRNLLRSLPAANLFINPTNLSWFDGTSALAQGLQIAQARALEAGRPLLRTATTGITAHIDHRGQVVSRLEAGGAGVLSGVVQPMAGQTPYARFGDWPALAGCLITLGLFVRPRRRALAERPLVQGSSGGVVAGAAGSGASARTRRAPSKRLDQ